MKKRFIPVTPGETPLFDLESSTEDGAWKKLLKAASHMPYRNRKEFEERGYEVCELINPEGEQ